MTDTIPASLRDAAVRHGEHPAYVDGTRTVTYAELLERVRATATDLIRRGLQPSDRVVIWGPNSIAWAVTALAVTYAGGTLVPVNSRYVGPEVADIVDRTRARFVYLEDGFLGRQQRTELQDASSLASVVDVLDLNELANVVAEAEADRRADAVSPDDVADILFTSGTTGRPKGVMSAHRQTVGAARTWGELGRVSAEDRYLVVNPFFHSFGYKVGIVTALTTGVTLYPMATFDVDATMRLIQDEQITLLPGAPTIFSSILAAPDRASYDLSSLRLAVTGAATIPIVLIERMRDELGIDTVVTAFGQTEAVVATMCRDGDDAETIATTCGRPVPGIEARIDARAGQEGGELLLRGDNVMLGYLDDPEATAEAIDPDGWLHTGDVGTLDEAGNLRITDRIKDMYISGGFNVYPAEVEQVLARLDGVADVAVVGTPDERLGEVGRAFVVRHDSAPLDVDAVVDFARGRLANFKVPRHVEFVDALPRNLAGKVLKNELRSSP